MIDLVLNIGAILAFVTQACTFLLNDAKNK